MTIKTLKHIMGAVKSSPNIPEVRRRLILSALNTAARCIGRDPGDILGTPAALQKELADANFLIAGVSKHRWTNVRSLTLEALRASGAKVAPSRIKRSNYSEAWTALRRALPAEKYRIGMSRFFTYCARHGIEPDRVDSTTFAGFKKELTEGSIVRKPMVVFSHCCRRWDKAGATVPEWPSYRTAIGPAVRGYSLKWTAFPPSLTEDVEAFLNRGANQDIFADDYAPSVSPYTTLGRRKVLRQMATALVLSGIEAVEVTDLSVFVRPENAKTILKFFISRNGGKPNEAIYSHACLLRTISRVWVKNVPDHTAIDKLGRNIRDQLKRGGKRRGMKQRNIERLRQFDDPRNVETLLGLPFRLMREAAQLDTGTSDSATIALYGAAIEILISTAIRVKNLTNLKIRENLIMPNDPRGQAIVWVPGEDVKNGNTIEVRLSESGTKLMRRYLTDFRPNISESPSEWLFPNRAGQRRNIVGFSAAISDVIYRQTGLEMHSHLFRHFALKMLERERPGSAEIGRRLLGHYNIQTTLNSYAENGSDAAHQQFEHVIDSNRAHLRLDLGDRS